MPAQDHYDTVSTRLYTTPYELAEHAPHRSIMPHIPRAEGVTAPLVGNAPPMTPDARPGFSAAARGTSKDTSTPIPDSAQALTPPIDARKYLRRQAIRVALTALSLAFPLLLPLGLTYWYLCHDQTTTFDWASGNLYSTAPAMRLNLIGTISVNVSKAIVGPLMALYAYVVASDWLVASFGIEGDGTGNEGQLPTPLHLATAMSLFQGARLSDVFSALRGALYARKTDSSPSRYRQGRVRWPPLLRHSLAVLVWLLALSLGIAAVNLWLHIDAGVSDRVPTKSPAALGLTPANALFARRLNETLCGSQDPEDSNGEPYASCGLKVGGSTSFDRALTLANQVYTNSSTLARSVWLDDNTAVLAPVEPVSVGYTARGIGARAGCRSIMKECTRCETYEPNVNPHCEPFGSANSYVTCEGDVRYNVSSSGRIGADEEHVFGNADANPIPWANRISSESYYSEQTVENGIYFIGESGFFTLAHRRAINIMYCTIDVYNITYEYTPPATFVNKESVLSVLRTTTILASGLDIVGSDGAPPVITTAIDGYGQIPGGESYSDAYGRRLSQLAVASLAGSIVPPSVEQVLPGVQVGSRCTLWGFVILIILDILLVLTILCVGVSAALHMLARKSPYICGARSRLLSVYPLLSDSLGGLKYDFERHSHVYRACEDAKSFVPETEADRLALKVEALSDEGLSTVSLRPRRVFADE